MHLNHVMLICLSWKQLQLAAQKFLLIQRSQNQHAETWKAD